MDDNGCMNQAIPDAQRLRSQMYGEVDLGGLTLFSGGFINYGYWPSDLDFDGRLTVAQRTDSQAELYRQAVARLGLSPGARLLELGCGKGAGAALVAREFAPGLVAGLDLSGPQLARAAAGTASNGNGAPPRLLRGSALRIPIATSAVDGVYCVEAAQHMDDHAALAAEAHRVLRAGGRFAVAGFFAPGAESEPRLAELLETVGNGIDVVVPVSGFAAGLERAGFGAVEVEPIGERVWPGLDAWIAQTEYHDSWGRNWLTAYRNGWVDYHFVHATA